MPDDIDIYRSAKVLIDKYGPAAEYYAEELFEKHHANDDVKSAEVWLAIIKAIEVLLDSKGGDKCCTDEKTTDHFDFSINSSAIVRRKG